MSKQEFDKTYFVSFCIEQYKVYRGISGAEVANVFYSNHIDDYLNDNYEVLHTQSRQWLMEEIDERLNASETV